MRTLRSGKSLPEAPPVRRPGSTNALPKPATEASSAAPAPRRGSTGGVPRRGSTVTPKVPEKKDVRSQSTNEIPITVKKEQDVISDCKNGEKSTAVQPSSEQSNSSKEPDKIEAVIDKTEGVVKVEDTSEEPATVEVNQETSAEEPNALSKGRPRKSARKSEPKVKVEVSPTPPTERLAKTEICQVCGMGFTRKATLLRHSQIHEVEEPEPEPTPKRKSVPKTPKPEQIKAPTPVITCDLCGLTFTRKAHLDRHALLHTGERPFPCDLCDLKFTRKDHMLTHRVKHAGEPEITCTVCGLNFSSMTSLDDHVKEEHPIPDSQPDSFTCETCGKYFLQKRYLQAHRKLHMRKMIESETFEHTEIEYQSPNQDPKNKRKSEHSEIQYQSAQQRVRVEQRSNTPQFSGFANNRKPHKAMVYLNRVVKLSADLALKSLKGCDTDVEICLQDLDKNEDDIEIMDNNDASEEMDYDYETMVKQLPFEEGNENSKDDTGFSISEDSPQQECECSVCGRSFGSDRSALRKHYRVHKKKFICRFCGLRLASAGSLMRHNLIHTGRKEFACTLCPRKFSRKDTLAVHLSAHDKLTTKVIIPRPYSCKKCGMKYNMKNDLIRHLKMCPSTSSSNLNDVQSIMNQIKFSAANPAHAEAEKDMVISLMPDLESIPQRIGDEQLYKKSIKPEPFDDYDDCDMAQWNSFETEEDLETSEDEPPEADGTNEQEGGEDGQYECDHCDKIFKSPKSLNTHKWYHSRDKQFICHICNRGFKYSTDLNRHITTHKMSKEINIPTSKPVPAIPKSRGRIQSRPVNPPKPPLYMTNAVQSRPFGCKLCPQRFNHRSNLSRHVRLLHNSLSAGKKVPSSVRLQNYLQKLDVKPPTSPAQPVQINKVIQQAKPQQQRLKLEAKETDRSRREWNETNMSNASNGSSSHLQHQEMDDLESRDFSYSVDYNSSKPYSCNVCQKGFENKSNLWTHMRIHNKIFVCSFCGLKVATHGDLVLHVRTHTGERPFSCNLCEWKFSRKSALNKHTQKYHTPGKGQILRPWRHREHQIDDNNGNLKFKFIRSSPQNDNFQIQKMGNGPNFNTSHSPGMGPQNLKPLPRLSPSPLLKPEMKILKSVLQGPGSTLAANNGPRISNSAEPGPSSRLPQLQRSPAVSAQGGKPPSRTNVLFVCRKCKKLINGKANYIEHMKTHQDETDLQREPQKLELRFNPNVEGIAAKPRALSEAVRCKICGFTASSPGFLSRHYQYVHPGTSDFEDQFTAPELDPPKSQLNYRSMPQMVRMHDREEGQFLTNESNWEKGFSNDAGNDSVSPRIGPDGTELPTPCERCGKEFNSKKARSDHVWYCKRNKIYRCPVSDCSKEFKLKHDVIRHLKRHTNDKRFNCTVCQEKFFHKQDLEKHQQNVHKIALSGNSFPCDFCDLRYNTEDSLNRHMAQTHGVESSDFTDDARNYQSNETGARGLIRSRSSMEDEYEDFMIENDMENGEFEENEDEHEMPDPSSFLEQSMGEESTEQQQNWECEICGKVCESRQKYMYHKYYHEREAKYNCTDCEEKFKLRSHLERHIRTYHNNLKPANKILHCKECPRRFTREYDLKTHIHKVHTISTAPAPHPLSILKTTLVMGNEEEKDNDPIPSTSKKVNKNSTINQKPDIRPVPSQPKTSTFQNNDESEDCETEYSQHDQQDQDNDVNTGESQTSDYLDLESKDGVFKLHNGTYTCQLCEKVFKEKKAADAHWYYHTREEKHACEDCGARFKQNSDLQRHNRIHHNTNNPKVSIHCPHCKRSFNDDRYMRMHIRRYHSEASQQGSIESNPEENNSKSGSKSKPPLDKFQSNIKKEPIDYDNEYDGNRTGVYNYDENLVDLTIVENDNEEENSSIIENWGVPPDISKDPADDGQNITDDDDDMNTIEEVEYRNYQATNEASGSKSQSCSVTCSSCGCGLEDTNAIKLHVCSSVAGAGQGRRSDNLTFDCTVCGAQFGRSNELILHNRIHTGIKPFICNKCPRPRHFVQRADLNAHLQSEHSQSMQMFDCQFCPKRFFVRKSLDSHRRRSHANIIQFHTCRQCGKKFTAHKFLEAHSRNCSGTDLRS